MWPGTVLLWLVYFRSRWLVFALSVDPLWFLYLLPSFKLPSARSGRLVVENSRTGPRVCESFPELVVICLGYSSIGWIRVWFIKKCFLGVVWLGGLQDYPGNFCTPLARILYGRRDPDIASFCSQLWSIRCIHNMAGPPGIIFAIRWGWLGWFFISSVEGPHPIFHHAPALCPGGRRESSRVSVACSVLGSLLPAWCCCKAHMLTGSSTYSFSSSDLYILIRSPRMLRLWKFLIVRLFLGIGTVIAVEVSLLSSCFCFEVGLFVALPPQAPSLVMLLFAVFRAGSVGCVPETAMVGVIWL